MYAGFHHVPPVDTAKRHGYTGSPVARAAAPRPLPETSRTGEPVSWFALPGITEVANLDVGFSSIVAAAESER